MPNIKSSKKDVIRSKVAYEKNKAEKSAMKTAIKKFEAAVAAGEAAEIESQLRATSAAVDKAAAKHVMHKNAANRKKAQLARAAKA